MKLNKKAPRGSRFVRKHLLPLFQLYQQATGLEICVMEFGTAVMYNKPKGKNKTSLGGNNVWNWERKSNSCGLRLA